MKKEIAKMRAQRAALEKELMAIATEATLAAIEAATDATPPVMDDLRGTKTRSGELKAYWATYSSTAPVKRGRTLVTVLANPKEYASYVNDGHRMNRHFVPHLVVNDYSGLLEYNEADPRGIMVGTKTSYVPGVFMAEKGEEAYADYLEGAMDRLAEVLK